MLDEINYFKDKGYLTFQVKDPQSNKSAVVMYNLKKQDVLCSCTTSLPCYHVRFLFEVFNDNETWMLQDLIEDWTKYRPQVIQLNEMYLAIQKAAYKKPRSAMLETTNRLMGEIKQKKQRKPRAPKPFSLIELD